MKPLALAPSVGEIARVWLIGETPWAECVALLKDGSWIGVIDNDLVNTSAHGLHYGSVVRFVRTNSYDDVWLWMPNMTMRSLKSPALA